MPLQRPGHGLGSVLTACVLMVFVGLMVRGPGPTRWLLLLSGSSNGAIILIHVAREALIRVPREKLQRLLTSLLQVVILSAGGLFLLWAFVYRPPLEVSYRNSHPDNKRVAVKVSQDLIVSDIARTRITGNSIGIVAVAGRSKGAFPIQIVTTKPTLDRWRLQPIPSSVYVAGTAHQPHILAHSLELKSKGKLVVDIDASGLNFGFSGNDAPKSMLQVGSDLTMSKDSESKEGQTLTQASIFVAASKPGPFTLLVPAGSHLGSKIINEDVEFTDGQAPARPSEQLSPIFIHLTDRLSIAQARAPFRFEAVPLLIRFYALPGPVSSITTEVSAQEITIYHSDDPAELRVGEDRSIFVQPGRQLKVAFDRDWPAQFELTWPAFIGFHGKSAVSVKIDGREQLPRYIQSLPWYVDATIGALIAASLLWALRGVWVSFRTKVRRTD